jgi:hypothetical protein
MKNLTTHTKSSQVRVIFLAIFLPVLFMVSGCSNTRKVANLVVGTTVKLNSDILIGEGECVLNKFEGTSVNNTFYLYWTFKSNTNNFLFEIESSANGKKFSPLCFKQGCLSPGSSSLMLCVTDSAHKGDVVYYRIKAISGKTPLKNNTAKEYKTLYEASTIMLTKNKKTKGYMQDETLPYPTANNGQHVAAEKTTHSKNFLK